MVTLVLHVWRRRPGSRRLLGYEWRIRGGGNRVLDLFSGLAWMTLSGFFYGLDERDVLNDFLFILQGRLYDILLILFVLSSV